MSGFFKGLLLKSKSVEEPIALPSQLHEVVANDTVAVPSFLDWVECFFAYSSKQVDRELKEADQEMKHTSDNLEALPGANKTELDSLAYLRTR
jgi:hypothetical protein